MASETASKIERIHRLLGDIEDDIRRQQVQDILIDLRDALTDAPEIERPGYRAAIGVIEVNHL
jgi:hypothetical protein